MRVSKCYIGYYYYNEIYQPLLYAHINSRYNSFKSEVMKDSNCDSSVQGKVYRYNPDEVDTD